MTNKESIRCSSFNDPDRILPNVIFKEIYTSLNLNKKIKKFKLLNIKKIRSDSLEGKNRIKRNRRRGNSRNL